MKTNVVMLESGIYKISSIIKNERVYVGSAVSFKRRRITHFSALINNKHDNQRLQNHYNKYGAEDLLFEIIEICDKGELLAREQFYIDTLSPFFNIAKIAGNCLGIKRSEESRQRMSLAQKGRISNRKGARHSAESILKMSSSKKGKRHSESQRIKIGIAGTGKEKPMLRKKVFCIQTNQEFKSLSDAAKQLGLNKANLGQVCNGKRKTINGLSFKYIHNEN